MTYTLIYLVGYLTCVCVFISLIPADCRSKTEMVEEIVFFSTGWFVILPIFVYTCIYDWIMG